VEIRFFSIEDFPDGNARLFCAAALSGPSRAGFPSCCCFPSAEHTQHIPGTPEAAASLRDAAYLHKLNDHVWEVWMCAA